MRKFITLGFDATGVATILRQSNEERREHVQGLSAAEKSDFEGYSEVVVVEVGGRSVVKRKLIATESAVVPQKTRRAAGSEDEQPMQTSRVGGITVHHRGDAPLGSGPVIGRKPAAIVQEPAGDELATELHEKKVAELKEIAASEGVELTGEMKKDEIVAAIVAKRSATSETFPPA